MNRRYWNHIKHNEWGFSNFISSFLYDMEAKGKIYFPNVRMSESIYIFSDYSENKHFYSYSFLLIDQQSLQLFQSVQQNFWEQNRLGDRIIEYKKLNDKIRRQALIPFLKLCNDLNGVILTLLIDKRIKTIFEDKLPGDLEDQLKNWRSAIVREKILRFRVLVPLLINGLASSCQQIHWITDNDDFIANSNQLELANKIFKSMLDKYLDFKPGEFKLMNLSDDNDNRSFEKLSSLADLTAGVLADYVGNYQKKGEIPSSETTVGPITHNKEKIPLIMKWFLDETELLKKNTIGINLENPDSFILSAYRFPEMKD